MLDPTGAEIVEILGALYKRKNDAHRLAREGVGRSQSFVWVNIPVREFVIHIHKEYLLLIKEPNVSRFNSSSCFRSLYMDLWWDINFYYSAATRLLRMMSQQWYQSHLYNPETG
ncbi:hypothetical protein GQ457_11G031470 [Hibiscus cannabinus]